MTFPHTTLDLRVEMAFGAEADSPLAWQWTDVSEQYRLLNQTMTIRRGRADESAIAQPSTVSFVLDNSDGALTPGNAGSPWWPDVRRGTPVRIWSEGTQPALLLPGQAGSYASTPDHADFDVVDLDLRIRVQPDQWAGKPSDLQILMSKAAAPSGISWVWDVIARGEPRAQFSTDGTSLFNTAQDGLVAAIRPAWLGVTILTNNGAGEKVITYYIDRTDSPPADVTTWELVGQHIDTVVAPIFQGVAPVEIGSYNGGQPSFNPSAPGFRGRVLAAEVRSGINGPIIADPDFTAQTPGTTSFVDTTGKTWTLHGDAAIGTQRIRFVGSIDDLTLEWPDGDNYANSPIRASESRAHITASGLLRRLSQGQAPFRSALYRGAVRPPLSSAFQSAYWPCEDGDNAVRLTAGLSKHGPITIAGWETGTDDSLISSRPLPKLEAGQPGSWSGAVPSGLFLDDWAVTWLMKIPVAETSPTFTRLMTVKTEGDGAEWRVSLTNGHIELEVVDAAGAVVALAGITVSTASITGPWVVAHLDAENFFGGTTNWELSFRPLSDGAEIVGTGSFTDEIGRVLSVGVDTTGPPSGMSFGHVTVHDTFIESDWLDQAANAWVGETAAARFARICTEEDVPVEIVGDFLNDPLGDLAKSSAMGPQRERTFLELLSECIAIDLGVAMSRRSAPGLVYRTRQSMYSQAVALNLDANLEGITAPVRPRLDDQRLRNDVTVSTVGGSSANAVDEALVDREGLYEDNPMLVGVGGINIRSAVDRLGLSALVDSQNEDQAAWRLHLGTWPDMRFPKVATDLNKTPALIGPWNDVELGDRIVVRNLPEQYPEPTVELILESVEETMAPKVWRPTLTCSPGGPLLVGPLVDDLFDTDHSIGRLAATDTALSGAVSKTATSLPLAAGGWTADLFQFPLLVDVEGEQIEVAGISGDTIQTLTGCTRSVNGVAKAHEDGAVVQVARPFRVGLGAADYTERTAPGDQFTMLFEQGAHATWQQGPTVLWQGNIDLVNDWTRYGSPYMSGLYDGNNDWGGRRHELVSGQNISPGIDVLQVHARQGVPADGPDDGILIHGGVKLKGAVDHSFQYGRVRVRAKVENDADEVTSGICLLWPATNIKGFELNLFENFSFRDDRSPIQSFLHWGDGTPQRQYQHVGLATSDWHDYEVIWKPNLVTVQIDDNPPRVMATDTIIPEVPNEPMELAFQLDAWPHPSISSPDPQNPAHQPVLTGTRRLHVAYLSIETIDGVSP